MILLLGGVVWFGVEGGNLFLVVLLVKVVNIVENRWGKFIVLLVWGCGFWWVYWRIRLKYSREILEKKELEVFYVCLINWEVIRICRGDVRGFGRK